MASLEEIRAERIKKLNILKERGMDPYPASSHYDVTIKNALVEFSSRLKDGGEFSLVGRVRAVRGQGGLVFFNIDDGTGSIQGVLKKEGVSEDVFSLFVDTIDIGDFLEITGTFFETKRGEKSLLLNAWRILAKSIRPLPDKWHGLSDIEERFRRRYLDIIMSDEVKNRFIVRSKVISFIRAFLDSRGYLEVETPVLQPLYGGASAEPFITHHNALDNDFYLRISDELYLKRLLVAGFPKIYEISKDFRNEGIDATHSPEFTMLEFYEAYSDATTMRVIVEEMLREIVIEVLGAPSMSTEDGEIDFKNSFSVISYYDLFKKYTNIKDISTITLDELITRAKEIDIIVNKGDNKESVMDAIYKKLCRPNLVQPTFIIDYPINFLPLAKKKKGSDTLVDAFQLVVGGVELVKAFSELNDPLDQRLRFEKQEQYKEKGDSNAQRMDEDFIEAMEYGIPPSGGVGIGIDRLLMLLTGTKNIKEVIIFPTLRPKK